ncbi:MAG: hypothetical protein DRN06_04140, partial [Thermoprotei archaeon]
IVLIYGTGPACGPLRFAAVRVYISKEYPVTSHLWMCTSLAKNLYESEKIRIYHGFGDPVVAIKNKHSLARIGDKVFKKKGEYFILNVRREAIVHFYDEEGGARSGGGD